MARPSKARRGRLLNIMKNRDGLIWLKLITLLFYAGNATQKNILNDRKSTSETLKTNLMHINNIGVIIC